MTKQDKRTEIVHAALALIAEQGFHGAPMAMIANRAGVGAGTIYRYFANKDELIAELYRGIEGKIFPYILEGYSEELPVRERFLHLGTTLLRYFIHHPLDFRYMEQFYNSPFGVEKRRDKLLGKTKKRDVYHQLFVEGIALQVFKDLPLPILFALSFGPLFAVARDHILGFVALNDELIGQTIKASWDGIKR